MKMMKRNAIAWNNDRKKNYHVVNPFFLPFCRAAYRRRRLFYLTHNAEHNIFTCTLTLWTTSIAQQTEKMKKKKKTLCECDRR